jgi:hypothetical protein
MVIDVSKENKKPIIIGVVGLIGAGKDTIADYLQNIHQFRRESFAHTLKDAVAAVFGWDRELLEGRTKESRAWREQVDTWWAERLNMPNLTPRLVLQLWGTEVCRKGFHDNIWIASLENKLRKTTDDVVISDCRFPNEIKAIKEAGGIVIRVIRGPEPKWYNLAKIVNEGPNNNIEWRLSKDRLEKFNVHASETAWVGTEFDAIIDNNADGLDNLYKQIKSLVQDPRAAKSTSSS